MNVYRNFILILVEETQMSPDRSKNIEIMQWDTLAPGKTGLQMPTANYKVLIYERGWHENAIHVYCSYHSTIFLERQKYGTRALTAEDAGGRRSLRSGSSWRL